VLKKSIYQINNIRLFIAFRVFFNARFYYPVFTILFLDFGLTLEQFALLNVVWALTIVVVEVPSGALADIIGRRNLLVSTGVLMVAEIALLCFAPRGDARVLFILFLANRVLSGTAEAAASGADEALAYDALKAEGDIRDWGRVLETQMRFQSIAFIVAMSVGAAVYDPALMGKVAGWLGVKTTMTQGVTLRFPLFLTLLMAVMTLITTLRMKEVPVRDGGEKAADGNLEGSVLQALKVTLRAGGWILKTPFALVIITTAVVFDHIIRMIVTLSSQYYRLIELPEASFGLIGSGLAVLGLFIPRVARRLAEHRSPGYNLGVMAVLTFSGLLGTTFFLPFVGLAPLVVLYSVFYFLNFFVSHYLNRMTSSSQRATVLSFKGLSLNLAYGLIGVFYSLLLGALRTRVQGRTPDLVGQGLENVIFIKSFAWFPWYFLFMFVTLLLFARWQLRDLDVHKQVG
jgi:MFS family permease